MADYGEDVHVRHYLSVAADSRRWNDFELRDGDIVISTPPKSGTTWTQMLVGLLIFDGPDFPEAMSRLSPWLDFDLTPKEEIHERLGSQTHRRFIKTHVPLDGLPLDSRVTYVVVGRDPRDVYLSMGHHMENLDIGRQKELLFSTMTDDEIAERFASSPMADTFLGSLELEPGRSQSVAHVAHVLRHLWTGWERRDNDNVVLLHYRDLKDDTAAELGLLAQRLGYDYSEDRIAELATHSHFDTMRDRADHLAPDAHLGAWKSSTDFFREGRMSAWRDELSPNEVARYAERVDELYSDGDFLAWAHNGRAGGDWRQ